MGGEDFEPVTDDRVRGIRMYFWAEDNRHIVYIQDQDGDENWRVYTADPATKEVRDLTPFDGVQAQLICKSRHFPDTLLVGLNEENPELHDVYRLTLSSGERDLAAKNPGNVVGWVADRDFLVRGALAATLEGGFDLLLRDNEASEWNKVIGWDKEDALSSAPVGFTPDGARIYLLDSRNANAARLTVFDPEDGGSEVLVGGDRYDIGNVMVHPDTEEVQAAAVVRARPEWTVLDKGVREDFEAIKELAPGDFDVVSRDHADENWLVAFTNDDESPSYYSYNRREKSGEHLFNAWPELDSYELVSMRPVSFTSRDGLQIEGYLTLPPGTRAAKVCR